MSLLDIFSSCLVNIFPPLGYALPDSGFAGYDRVFPH